jgi:O-methyltransferase involved in polyketide biosynthesis
MSSPDMERLGSTGLWTATVRARESAQEDPLFVDPLDALFASSGGSAWLDRMYTNQQSLDYATIGIVIRTRFFDDFLLRATRDAQIGQVVRSVS